MEGKSKNTKYYVLCTTAWLIYAPAAFVALIIALILAGVEPISRGQVIGAIGIFIATLLGYLGLFMETIRIGKEKQANYKKQLTFGLASSIAILAGLFAAL